jgi:polar amino acid transport system substrate-binding protein
MASLARLGRLRDMVLDAALALAALAIFSVAILAGLPRLGNDDSIRIATALLPPQMGVDGEGQEAEIIKAALAAGGIAKPIHFHVMPFTRHWKQFNTDTRYHAVTTVPSDLALDGFRSDTYVEYQNGVAYRVDTFPGGLGGAPLAAIAAKRIVAFAGAAAILPPMREVSLRAPLYMERQDQVSHSIMFTEGLVDVVVADELIFDFYTRQVLGERYADYSKRLEFDPIFCPTPYQMLFRDAALRDAFNKGLQVIRANGMLRAINRKYLAKLSRPARMPPRC